MVFAVTAWTASALAVIGYTYIAFKETATDLEGMALSVEGGINPLVASANLLDAELNPQPEKKLDRERFKKSR